MIFIKEYLRKIADEMIKVIDEKLIEERKSQEKATSFKKKRDSVEREIKLLVDKRGLLATNLDHLRITIDSCKEFNFTPEEWSEIKNKVEEMKI